MERPERKIAATGVTRQILVRPEAEAEVQQAFDWYEEQSKGLGLEFLRAIEACLSGVTRSSLAYTSCQSPKCQTRCGQTFSVCLVLFG